MKISVTDVMIYSRNRLDDQQFEELKNIVYQDEAVISFSRNEHLPQCLMVVYNSASTQAISILRSVTGFGIKASLVGI